MILYSYKYSNLNCIFVFLLSFSLPLHLFSKMNHVNGKLSEDKVNVPTYYGRKNSPNRICWRCVSLLFPSIITFAESKKKNKMTIVINCSFNWTWMPFKNLYDNICDSSRFEVAEIEPARMPPKDSSRWQICSCSDVRKNVHEFEFTLESFKFIIISRFNMRNGLIIVENI